MRGGKFKLDKNFDRGRKQPLTEGAKYGYALLNLGNRNDKDNHGKEMFAVGAPYEDGGKGAIYIYIQGKYKETKFKVWTQIRKIFT